MNIVDQNLVVAFSIMGFIVLVLAAIVFVNKRSHNHS